MATSAATTKASVLSVPETFPDSNFGLWLPKFELCSKANVWKEDETLKAFNDAIIGQSVCSVRAAWRRRTRRRI
jgi:hypothetical protein